VALRQVTRFNEGGSPPPVPRCFGPDAPACSVGEGYYRVVFRDPVTDAVVFASNCDPLGSNPLGAQIFAMRPDGSGLRQQTDAAGVTPNPDGGFRVGLARTPTRERRRPSELPTERRRAGRRAGQRAARGEGRIPPSCTLICSWSRRP